MSEELRNEVFQRFDGLPEIELATVEGDQPKVRPVMLMHFDKKLYVATGTESNKVNQIRGNPKMEFCLRLPEGENVGYVRAAGTAEIVDNLLFVHVAYPRTRRVMVCLVVSGVSLVEGCLKDVTLILCIHIHGCLLSNPRVTDFLVLSLDCGPRCSCCLSFITVIRL